MAVPLMPVIPMVVVSMGMGRAWTRLALFHRRFFNFLGRKMACYILGNFYKCLCRDTVGSKLDDGDPDICRLGKLRVKGNRAEEWNVHHAGQALPFIVA